MTQTYIIEIRAAEGGEDSRLFTRDLATSYQKLASKFGWKSLIVHDSLNEIYIQITGENLEPLKLESGGHRIQRVPPTERKGRVHTSTVTVAVLPKSEKKTLDIKKSDIKIEWYSGTGAGGQHRNKHQNSCRLTHIPTGVIVTSQCRSRENSLDEAMNELISRLQRETQYKTLVEESNTRKALVGSGMRGDKRRTYRFQDDIVVDDISGIKSSVRHVLAGNFDIFW